MFPELPDCAETTQWRSALANHDLRTRNPDLYRSLLHEQSNAMVASELIDWMDKLEMDEMANASYWFALEELAWR